MASAWASAPGSAPTSPQRAGLQGASTPYGSVSASPFLLPNARTVGVTAAERDAAAAAGASAGVPPPHGGAAVAGTSAAAGLQSRVPTPSSPARRLAGGSGPVSALAMPSTAAAAAAVASRLPPTPSHTKNKSSFGGGGGGTFGLGAGTAGGDLAFGGPGGASAALFLADPGTPGGPWYAAGAGTATGGAQPLPLPVSLPQPMAGAAVPISADAPVAAAGDGDAQAHAQAQAQVQGQAQSQGAAQAQVQAQAQAQAQAAPAAPIPISVGQVLNRKWKLLRIVGRGAFGHIFVARRVTDDPQRRKHKYAIKIEKLRDEAIAPAPAPAPAPAAGDGNANAKDAKDPKAATGSGADNSPHVTVPTAAQVARMSADEIAAANAALLKRYRSVLRLEAIVLKKLQTLQSPAATAKGAGSSGGAGGGGGMGGLPICKFVEYGVDVEFGVAFLVMSLLGDNLFKLRRRRREGRFSLPTTLRFGVQAVRSIQLMHDAGFLHRDIKPSNFVIGVKPQPTSTADHPAHAHAHPHAHAHGHALHHPAVAPNPTTGDAPAAPHAGGGVSPSSSASSIATSTASMRPVTAPASSASTAGSSGGSGSGSGSGSGGAVVSLNGEWLQPQQTIYMIDFGLARSYRAKDNSLLPPRAVISGFRGTPRYASMHVHREQDLSRRDDLWSLLYIFVEFLTGDLPWGTKRDKDDIGRVKALYTTPHTLLRGIPGPPSLVPDCLEPWMTHLMSLRFEDTPDYDLLVRLLEQQYARLGVEPDAPFDWEEPLLPTHTLSFDAASLREQIAAGAAAAAAAAAGPVAVVATGAAPAAAPAATATPAAPVAPVATAIPVPATAAVPTAALATAASAPVGSAPASVSPTAVAAAVGSPKSRPAAVASQPAAAPADALVPPATPPAAAGHHTVEKRGAVYVLRKTQPSQSQGNAPTPAPAASGLAAVAGTPVAALFPDSPAAPAAAAPPSAVVPPQTSAFASAATSSSMAGGKVYTISPKRTPTSRLAPNAMALASAAAAATATAQPVTVAAAAVSSPALPPLGADGLVLPSVLFPADELPPAVVPTASTAPVSGAFGLAPRDDADDGAPGERRGSRVSRDAERGIAAELARHHQQQHNSRNRRRRRGSTDADADSRRDDSRGERDDDDVDSGSSGDAQAAAGRGSRTGHRRADPQPPPSPPPAVDAAAPVGRDAGAAQGDATAASAALAVPRSGDVEVESADESQRQSARGRAAVERDRPPISIGSPGAAAASKASLRSSAWGPAAAADAATDAEVAAVTRAVAATDSAPPEPDATSTPMGVAVAPARPALAALDVSAAATRRPVPTLQSLFRDTPLESLRFSAPVRPKAALGPPPSVHVNARRFRYAGVREHLPRRSPLALLSAAASAEALAAAAAARPPPPGHDAPIAPSAEADASAAAAPAGAVASDHSVDGDAAAAAVEAPVVVEPMSGAAEIAPEMS